MAVLPAPQPGRISTVEVPAASLGSELAVYLPVSHPLFLTGAVLPQKVVLLAREGAALEVAVRVVQERFGADLRLLPQVAGGGV